MARLSLHLPKYHILGNHAGLFPAPGQNWEKITDLNVEFGEN